MGNSESQYSFQGPRSNSFTFPVRQKPHSEEFFTPNGWWKSGSRVSGFRSKAMARGCFSQPKSNQSASSDLFNRLSKGSDARRRLSGQWRSSSEVPASENFHYGSLSKNDDRSECNGHTGNGYRTPDRNPRLEEAGDQTSPRVVIKNDGSVRVEFNQLSKSSLLPSESGGSVQLLKFSPTPQSVPSTVPHTRPDYEPTPAAASSIPGTSKGSSLSSEESWYDSPWGTGGEHNNHDEELSNTQTEHFSQPLPTTGISDLYRDSGMAATFPNAGQPKLANALPFKHRSSFVCVMEEPDIEDFQGLQQYSSFTLPCRKSESSTDIAGKKESIRNRMRRLSDWTGSLTRRKKKLKVKFYLHLTDTFIQSYFGIKICLLSLYQVPDLCPPMAGFM